jgi:CspA family cold shock protein
LKGKISKYLSYRGYGFISVEGEEKDIFFHMSKYPATHIPTQGQIVEFTVDLTPKGKEAVNIKVIEKGTEEEETPVESKKEAPKHDKEEKTEVKSIENDLDQLKGVGPKYRELLMKASINSCREITDYSPENLLSVLMSVNEKEQVTKRPPTLTQITDWISLAKEVV